MDNIFPPFPSPATDPAEARDAQLTARIGVVGDQTADALYGIGRVATLRGDRRQRGYLNDLGAGPEIFAALSH
ncbi:MAG: hypothetical protein ACR2RV_23475 [Verrucomicrobiales bacterium]